MADLRRNIVDRLDTQNTNFHGRRISNAKDAIKPQDYVTLSQLNRVASSISGQSSGSSFVKSDVIQVISYMLASPLTAVFVPVTSLMLQLNFTQDATGSRLVTFASEFVDPPDLTGFLLPNSRAYCFFVNDNKGNWVPGGVPLTNVL